VPVDEIRKGKPDPEGFLHAAERLGVPPSECIVFEDTRPGIEAGLNAGMQVVGLLTTLPADRLGHSLLVRDFRDVAIQPNGDCLHIEIRNAAL
jgi:sugar-phosphatase